MIISAIGQGFLWGILGLGIFMTYRILNFPDMTTEGSFPLGGAVCVTAITNGVSPIFCDPVRNRRWNVRRFLLQVCCIQKERSRSSLLEYSLCRD